jgi:rhomboid family GlyGly-CTERM serine protease
VTRAAAGRAAWLGMALLLAAFALVGWPMARDALDWQPALAFTEPWRAVTAVGVHYSGQHLGVNLAGLVVTALFGVAARAPAPLAAAWLAAWPLTQFGLLVKPELLHYGGLSGVLHAGFAVIVVFLLVTGTRAQRWVAAAVLIGGAAKLLNEAPWGPALRQPPGWDIAVAPLAHTTGALAGALCAAIALAWPRGDAVRAPRA